VKRAAAFILLTAVLFMSVACGGSGDASYGGEWFSFTGPYGLSLTEEQDEMRAEGDGIKIILKRVDVSGDLSEEWKDKDRELVDLRSGAFEDTYNNMLYVFELFKYLSPDGTLPQAPYEFEPESGVFWLRGGYSGGGRYGTILLTVEDGILYIAVINTDGTDTSSEAAEKIARSISVFRQVQ